MAKKVNSCEVLIMAAEKEIKYSEKRKEQQIWNVSFDKGAVLKSSIYNCKSWYYMAKVSTIKALKQHRSRSPQLSKAKTINTKIRLSPKRLCLNQ